MEETQPAGTGPVDLVLGPLPEPRRRQGQQMCYDGHDKAFFNCYDADQMHAYAAAEVARVADGDRQLLERALHALVWETGSEGLTAAQTREVIAALRARLRA
jgi:hypothetical protein